MSEEDRREISYPNDNTTSEGGSYSAGTYNNTERDADAGFRNPRGGNYSYNARNTDGMNYGYGNQSYSYGQNNYSYNNQGPQGYGTYQYSQNIAPEPVQPVKKKHTGAKVVAIICIVALVVGSIGYSFYSFGGPRGILARRGFGGSGPQIEESAQEDNGAESAPQVEPEEALKAQNAQEKQNTDAGEGTSTTIATTTTGNSMAVVTDVTAVVEEVMPAMVMIHNNFTQSANYFGYVQTEEAQASGSGIIVGDSDTELLVATNYHVIEGADTLEVIFTDDSTVEAVVKGTDPSMDLAVIAVSKDSISSGTLSQIKIATLGDSESLTLGEPAIAIGNALGYGQSVTTGVISAVNREVEISAGVKNTFIQTDAAINPGNSGGALLNMNGEVIGINSNKLGGTAVEGMGYAIPISDARPIIDRLMNEETKLKVAESERGYIGITGFNVTSDVASGYGMPLGVYVAEVQKGGGAEAAGMYKGDVIVGFDGNDINTMDELQTRLQYYKAGTEVSITIMRENHGEYEEMTLKVTLGNQS